MSSKPNDEFISIRYSKVPRYLHSSAFYKSLSAEGDHSGPMQIPCKSFKADDTVNVLDDLRLLLHTMIFWGLDVIPETALDFCHNNFLDEWQAAHAIADLPDSGGLYNILTECSHGAETILPAVDSGHPEIVQHWMRMHPPENLTVPTQPCTEAASIGNLQLLKELHNLKYSWDEETSAEAAAGGHFDCLLYLHEQGCPWAENACTAAAAHGHLECLKYLHEQGGPWAENACSEAAFNGHLDCLRYLHECGCPWIEDKICCDAARGGKLPCLKFAHEHGGILDDEVTCTWHIDCLRYALEHNCPVHANIYNEYSFSILSIEIVKLFTEHGVVWTGGQVQVSVWCTLAHTKYLFQQGCQYNDDIIIAAVMHKAPDHLAYLIDEALLEMSPELYSNAVFMGCLDCVQVLVDRGCPCDFVLDIGYIYGDIRFKDPLILSCIRYATERGWPCNEDLICFVCNYDLPLCWKYLCDEGIVDGTFASPYEYFQYMCKLRAVEK